MANLRAIRKRITTVKNTRQITKAMKLVSAAKLRRATDAAIAARPYNRKLKEILDNLLARMDEKNHPLFQPREQIRRIKVVAFSSDRGLCGSYNSNVNRRVDTFTQENKGIEVEYFAVGRKVRDYVRRRGYPLSGDLTGISPAAVADVARELALSLVKEFEDGAVDEVYLVYHQFKTAISQILVTERLLPFMLPTDGGPSGGASTVDYIYEPSQEAILDELLPQMMASRVMQAFLEALASEHGARMAAMDSATRNASEMIEKLTLEYNRSRQAAITKELVEIVSGAEAL